MFRPLPAARLHARRLKRPDTGFAVASMFTAELEDTANRLKASLDNAGVDYLLYQVPSVHRSLSPKGSDDLALAKPNFIHHAMEELQRPILCLDADMIVREFPSRIVDIARRGTDFAIYNWLADADNDAFLPVAVSWMGVATRGRFYRFSHRFDLHDPNQLVASGAVQYYARSPAARRLLAAWLDATAQYPAVADDQILDYVFNFVMPAGSVTTAWLGKEYCRCPWWIHVKPVIEHPDIPADPDSARTFLRVAGKPRFDAARAKKRPSDGPIPSDCLIDTQDKRLLRVVNQKAVVVGRLDQLWPASAELPDPPKAAAKAPEKTPERAPASPPAPRPTRPLPAAAPVPQAPPTWLNQAVTLHKRGELAQAEVFYRKVIAAEPDHFDAQHMLGALRHQQGRDEEALALIERALQVRPDAVEALSNRGIVLDALGRHGEALSSYERALALRPDDAEAHYNRANTLKELRRFPEALKSYDAAIAARPNFATALFNRGNVLTELKRPREALESYDRALAIRPGYVKALFNRGNVLVDLKALDEARQSFEAVAKADPAHAMTFGQLAGIALETCDFARTAHFAHELAAGAGGQSLLHPFLMIRYGADPAQQLDAAQKFLAHSLTNLPEPFAHGAPRAHDKIRLAYVSADFRAHPVAYLVADLFERHDRSRFEVTGISLGHDDGSDIRARIVNAFDAFHDVRSRSDADAARLIHELEIDIAVDLTGHTQDSRLAILAQRPAPIAVNLLGYPGSMGADFFDYVIADKIALPFAQQPFYSERIVHLPDCFQPNDTKRAIAEATPSREAAGLPDEGFVFCCFNNHYKLRERLFDIWMRLLRVVEGSVLWLSQANEAAAANLRREAEARGVAGERVIFAPRLARHEDHLARQRLADLFLDTLPYNAHTTASDALWAGLPVLTCRGETFAARVAASANAAIGLPELVTASLQDYEALALRLAREPARLRSLRERLARNRTSRPLFNSDRYRRHIEAAYTTMWETWQRGEAPKSFSVAPTTEA